MSSPASPADATGHDAAAQSSADRAAYVAVLVFPLLVLAGGLAGYLFAPTAVSYTHLTLPTILRV